MLFFKTPFNVYIVTIIMQSKNTTEVISLRLLSTESKRIESLSKKTGISVSAIARGLLRRGMEYQSDRDLIQLIKLGSIMKAKK